MNGIDYVIDGKHIAVAEWFSEVFGAFDLAILQFYHNFYEFLGDGFFGKLVDGFLKCYTHLGDEGILFIVLALIFLLFRKTRKSGFGMLVGMLFGLIFTNLVLKELIERPRPFILYECLPDNEAAVLFRTWWEQMGSIKESWLRSFPSGHTTSAFAAMVPLFMISNKKFSWTALVAALLMGASRNYVMVHYPSDVLFGIIVGTVAGILSFFVVRAIFNKLSEKDNKIVSSINNFDIIDFFKNRKKV